MLKYLFTTYPNVLPTFQIESSEQTILHWTKLHKFPACIAAWKHFMLIIIKNIIVLNFTALIYVAAAVVTVS